MTDAGIYPSNPSNNEGPKRDTDPTAFKDEKPEAAPEGPISDLRNVSFGSIFHRSAGDVLSKAKIEGSAALERASGLAEIAQDRITEATQAATKKLSEGSIYVAATSLEYLAGDPTQPRTTGGELTKIAPIVGSAKSYAEAWALYHHGLETDDKDMQHQARVKCVISMAEAGIDLGTLSAIKVARTPNAIRRALIAASSVKAVHSLDDVRDGLVAKLADRVLGSPKIAKLVDGLLSSVKPTKSYVKPEAEQEQPPA